MGRPERTSGAVSATSRTSAANGECSATGPRALYLERITSRVAP